MMLWAQILLLIWIICKIILNAYMALLDVFTDPLEIGISFFWTIILIIFCYFAGAFGHIV